MRVFVTGDRGYIGSTLVPMLQKENYDVIGLDTEYFTKLLDASSLPQYTSIKKDMRDVSKEDLRGVDSIIHLAALSNDPMGALDNGLTEKINFKASVRLAKLAKKCGVKRFLFSSSCSIYGIGKEAVVSEKSSVNPLTAYAKSKIATEKALQKLADKNFVVGLLRNSTVYGYSPVFRDDLVVNNFTACAVATKKIQVMSDGSPWRPLIDVRDLSKIFIVFLKKEEKKINGEVINIGFNENNFQVKTVLNLVENAVKGCKVVYTGEHGKDTRSYKVSFEKFSKLFPEIQQKWSLKKSIKDLTKHLQNGKFTKEDFLNHTYTRLEQLKNLKDKGKLSDDLYWY
ncbi:MAG TPA: SDR family oxidoreductase [Patescibacteria group bacterium]|nr:SDR family oxidoreductase [Patescibacteria group bacterium]